MYRIYFDTNEGMEGNYGLWLSASKDDMGRIPGGPQDGMRVVIYMTGELEMEAVLAFMPERSVWIARAVPGTTKTYGKVSDAALPPAWGTVTQELYVQASHRTSLPDFVKFLAHLMQSDPWEERESVNYPDGHYFRHKSGSLNIIAQLADDELYPEADFLIWMETGGERQIDALGEKLVAHGYAVARPKAV